MGVDDLQQHLLSMDSDAARFGQLLCGRLGYMHVQPGAWEGNEGAAGLRRKVSLVVKRRKRVERTSRLRSGTARQASLDATAAPVLALGCSALSRGAFGPPLLGFL